MSERKTPIDDNEVTRKRARDDDGHDYILTGDRLIKIDPTADLGALLFMHIQEGRDILVRRRGYMDVHMRSTDTIKVAKCLSIMGATAPEHKESQLPGTMAKADQSYKCI